ncbi:MAG: Tfp pilus assembly protein FimT/FimU [Phycisphaerales bacterium]
MKRSGISLLEVVIALGVIALLTALAITSLRRTRANTRDLRDTVSLGLTIRDFHAYANDQAGNYPNAGLAHTPESQWFFTAHLPPHLQTGAYFSQMTAWPRVMHHWSGRFQTHWHSVDGYNDLGGTYPPTVGWTPEITPDQHTPTLFLYSLSMLTHPDLWARPGVGPLSMEQISTRCRLVQTADVAFPSLKGVLLFRNREASGSWLVAFADGSASARLVADAAPPAAPPSGPPDREGVPVLNTVDGYRGRDF